MLDLTIHPPSRSMILTSTHSSLQSMWELTITPLWGPASLLALVPLSYHCGVSLSTPFRGPASLLALVPLSNRCGISQSTPLWVLAFSLAYHPVSYSDTICNNPILFALSFSDFPKRFLKCDRLGRGFHTPSSMNLRSNNPSPWEPNVLASTLSSLQYMWDVTIHPFGVQRLYHIHSRVRQENLDSRHLRSKQCMLKPLARFWEGGFRKQGQIDFQNRFCKKIWNKVLEAIL